MFILFVLIKVKVSKRKGNLAKSESNSLNLVFHEVIGKGSFGTVYKGSLKKQDVAVKVISRIRDSRGYNERNILYEQQGYENIVKILTDYSKTHKGHTYIYLVFEFVEQGTLRTYLANTTLNLEECLFLIDSLVSGLAYLHSSTMINSTGRKACVAHRDIKSANILVSKKHGCVIADFGLALNFDESKKSLTAEIIRNRQVIPEVIVQTPLLFFER